MKYLSCKDKEIILFEFLAKTQSKLSNLCLKSYFIYFELIEPSNVESDLCCNERSVSHPGYLAMMLSIKYKYVTLEVNTMEGPIILPSADDPIIEYLENPNRSLPNPKPKPFLKIMVLD